MCFVHSFCIIYWFGYCNVLVSVVIVVCIILFETLHFVKLPSTAVCTTHYVPNVCYTQSQFTDTHLDDKTTNYTWISHTSPLKKAVYTVALLLILPANFQKCIYNSYGALPKLAASARWKVSALVAVFGQAKHNDNAYQIIF